MVHDNLEVGAGRDGGGGGGGGGEGDRRMAGSVVRIGLGLGWLGLSRIVGRRCGWERDGSGSCGIRDRDRQDGDRHRDR